MEKICKNLCLYSQRLNSFKNWSGELSPETLAEAGFYAIGVNATICFCCNREFQDWKRFDNPWLKHWNTNPDCTFIKNNCCKIAEERNNILIENYLKSQYVKNLIENGFSSIEEMREAMIWYMKQFGIHY